MLQRCGSALPALPPPPVRTREKQWLAAACRYTYGIRRERCARERKRERGKIKGDPSLDRELYCPRRCSRESERAAFV